MIPESAPGAPARNAPLTVLAVLAAVFFLDWAQAVFVPLVLSVVLGYALAPVVDRLEKYSIPRALSAAVLLLAIVIGAGAAALSLREEAAALIETLPDAVQKIQRSVKHEFAGPGDAIENVQKAAEEIARATVGTTPSRAPPGVTRVLVEKPKLNIRDYLLTTAAGAVAAVGIGLMVLFLTYFLLASGDAFRRKWVVLSGPTLSRRRITVQVLDEIGHQVKRYLAVQLLSSVAVGVASGLAFWAIGLDNAAVWGIVAGVFNLVPYVGAIVVMGGTALVAFYQFGTVGMALAAAGISLLLHGLQNWLTPWLVSRANQMNAVVVFAGLLFWGWLWGGWGLLLGLPIMLIFKAICDHVEDLKPIGEFMGE
jgi:predicted PurR-regulated permease PerM